jgi:hypothetical protein
MGKSSRPRPYSVPLKDFDNTFDTIFGKKEAKPRWVPPPVIIEEEVKQTITFGNNYDSSFEKKENKMSVQPLEELKTVGSCGCGRSPTGKCIGWHGLNEEAYQARLAEFNAHQENSVDKPAE